MQACECEVRLRLPGGGPQHPQASGPSSPRGVRQQHALAHARITEHHEHLAFRRDRIDEGPEPGELGIPADDGPSAQVARRQVCAVRRLRPRVHLAIPSGPGRPVPYWLPVSQTSSAELQLRQLLPVNVFLPKLVPGRRSAARLLGDTAGPACRERSA